MTNATEAYRGVERMLDKLAWAYCDRRNADDWDECRSVANVAFARAHATYDPGRGTLFSSWVYTCAWGALRKHRDARARRNRRERQVSASRLEAEEDRPGYLDRLGPELGGDAMAVVQLIAESPKEFAGCFRFAACNPGRVRTRIGGDLLERKWSVARVVDAFDELREAVG